MASIRKDPHVLFSSPDVYSCLISMNERACQKTLQEEAFGLCIILGKVLEKVGDGRTTNLFVKQLLKGLDNNQIGQTEHHPLVNDPCLQAMPESLDSCEFAPYLW